MRNKLVILFLYESIEFFFSTTVSDRVPESINFITSVVYYILVFTLSRYQMSGFIKKYFKNVTLARKCLQFV